MKSYDVILSWSNSNFLTALLNVNVHKFSLVWMLCLLQSFSIISALSLVVDKSLSCAFSLISYFMTFAIYYILNFFILFWSFTDLAKETVSFDRVAIHLCWFLLSECFHDSFAYRCSATSLCTRSLSSVWLSCCWLCFCASYALVYFCTSVFLCDDCLSYSSAWISDKR